MSRGWTPSLFLLAGVIVLIARLVWWGIRPRTERELLNERRQMCGLGKCYPLPTARLISSAKRAGEPEEPKS